MIEYQLKDENGNTFSLNGASVTTALKQSLTQSGDTFEYANKIAENSYLPGSTLIGKARLQSRELTLSVDIANESSSDYRDIMNELLSAISTTKFIVDVTNNMQIEATPSDITIDYTEGALKNVSNNQFTFLVLTPYWEDLTKTTITGTALADTIKEVAVDNQGYLASPPEITLVTTAAVNSVQLYLTSNNHGIQIDDSLFGTSGNLTMNVDCNTGEVTIGTINRNASIVEGTGFFDFIVGSDTLNILCADEDVNYTIDFYKRYYL